MLHATAAATAICGFRAIHAVALGLPLGAHLSAVGEHLGRPRSAIGAAGNRDGQQDGKCEGLHCLSSLIPSAVAPFTATPPLGAHGIVLPYANARMTMLELRGAHLRSTSSRALQER